MASGSNKGTFAAFNPEAPIFEEIKKQKPEWWEIFRNDKELYIHIRKDNYISVYYNGHSVAKIEFKNGDFSAEIDEKFFPSKPNPNLSEIAKNLKNIKENIRKKYPNGNRESEEPDEKWLQSELILKNSNKYIDSEFEYKLDDDLVDLAKKYELKNDEDRKSLRLDLVELSSDGELSFTELKGITDDRLLNKARSLTDEFIYQMEIYKRFISKYESKFKDYYKELIKIKKDLQLDSPFVSNMNLTLNKTPNLLIIDTYQKDNEKRKNRIKDIKKSLEDHQIKYEIKSLSEI